jgi:hypothetical protein
LQHPFPNKSLLVRDFVEKSLIPSFLEERNFDKQIDKLAEIHFLMANAMIVVRGNAAISDWLTEALARVHGIELSSWRPGVMPDLEAMLMDQDEFVKKYRTLFTHPPVPRKERPPASN